MPIHSSLSFKLSSHTATSRRISDFKDFVFLINQLIIMRRHSYYAWTIKRDGLVLEVGGEEVEESS